MATLHGSTKALVDALDGHHQAAGQSLGGADGPHLRGVTWLSAHLAAVEHSLYPAAKDHAIIERNVKSARELSKILRSLEQMLAGDALTTHVSKELLDRLDSAMAAHTDAERDLVELLDRTLDAKAIAHVTDKLSSAMHHGPTRPHLHGPHSGPFEGMTFAAHAARDHMLDVLDSRSKPTEAERTAKEPVGRWGRYLVGMGETFDTKR